MKDFKNEINTKLAIPVELQKLIFCGRVLQDEKRLSEYEVNEKVVHLVKKQPQPPGSSAPPPEPNANNAGNNNARRPGQRDSSEYKITSLCVLFSVLQFHYKFSFHNSRARIVDRFSSFFARPH